MIEENIPLQEIKNVTETISKVNDVEIKEKVFDHDKFNEIKESLNSFISSSSSRQTSFASDEGFSFDLAKRAYENMQQQSFLSKSISNDDEENVVDTKEFKVIGTLFNTYILVEQDKTLLMIDQHAGHERLLYDRFKKDFENNSLAIQPLLVPYVLNLNYQEWSYIHENIETLAHLGFEIEEFGNNSFKVNSVPVLLRNINIAEFFNSILHDISSNLSIKKTDLMEEYLAKSACRSAVKANDILSSNEIDILLNQLSTPDQVLLCPHGRPIVLRITNTEIEKWFKRLV